MFNFIKVFRSTIIKNFLIYSLGSILLKSISVFIAPIIMRILTPADYGLLSLVTSFINILVAIAGLGLRQLLSIEYFHCSTCKRKSIVNDIVIVYIAIMVPVFIFLFLNMRTINNYIFLNKAYASLIAVSLLIVFFRFFNELFYQIMQYRAIAFKLTVVQIFAAILMFSLNLLFVYSFRLGVLGFFMAQLISIVTVSLLGILFYFGQSYHISLCIAYSLSKAGFYVRKGLPFIPRMLFAWILAVGDRWVLAKYSTLSNVGIYSVADMFGQLFQFIVLIPITYAYLPPLFEKFAANKKNILKVEKWNQKNMLTCMVIMFVLVSIGYFILRPLVYVLIPQKYNQSFVYVWFLLIGQIFLLGSYFASAFLQFQKRIHFLVISLLVPAGVNILLNIILIPRFHIWGCVFATVISYLFYFVITVFYNWYIQKKCFF